MQVIPVLAQNVRWIILVRNDTRYMSLLDLIKATVVCGTIAFLFFSFPVLGQIMAIAVMSIVWLSYARKTVVGIRGRTLA